MIEIRKGGTLRTTWEELKTGIKNNTSSLNIGDELDIVLKTGENVTLVCEYVGYKYATFFTKNLLEDTHCMNENWAADNENCLYYDYYWGCVEVVSPGFATKKECQEYFNTAKEFAFFR